MQGKVTHKFSETLKKNHPAADALDWNEAMRLIDLLTRDGRYRDSMLVSCGCFLGLRISDLIRLRWDDVCNSDILVIREKKTGKKRSMKINPELREHANCCREELGIEGNPLIFCSYGEADRPITRQRADQILKEAKSRYGIKSAKIFSTHSLRKTFGRRVWLQECDHGRGEQALLLLSDVFGHSSISITKRYLGIRQDEILSVYDSLM